MACRMVARELAKRMRGTSSGLPTPTMAINSVPWLATIDEAFLTMILSFLDPDGSTPGTHRAVARRFVGDRVQRKYLVHDEDIGDEPGWAGLASTVEAYRRQCAEDPDPTEWQCQLCYSEDGPIVDSRLGVVNPCTFMRLERIPYTEAACTWIEHNMDFEDWQLCLRCRQRLYVTSVWLPEDL